MVTSRPPRGRSRYNAVTLPVMFTEKQGMPSDEHEVLTSVEISMEGDRDPVAVDERRRYMRFPYDGVVAVTVAGEQHHVHAIDMSDGGLGCKPMPHWVRRGDPVLVQLTTPVRQFLGRIAWVRPVSGDEVAAGIRFTTPRPGLHKKTR